MSPSSRSSHKSLEVNLADANNPELALGQNAVFGFSGSSETLPTVPFGLNLGAAGKWDGSVIFGGDYDENRIYGQSGWVSIPETNDIQGTFLATGQLAVHSVTVQVWQYNVTEADAAADFSLGGFAYPFTFSNPSLPKYTVPAVFNFSSDSVVLPGEGLC